MSVYSLCMKRLFIIICYCISSLLLAQNFKLRIREKYEINTIKFNDINYKYHGFSNTLNFWYEDPYNVAIGLAYSPILSGLNCSGDNCIFGDEVHIFNYGLEIKYFINNVVKNVFVLPGIGYARLITRYNDSLPNYGGIYFYGSLGYEYPFDSFGFSMEIGYRYISLREEISISTIMPSVGFHFYKMF